MHPPYGGGCILNIETLEATACSFVRELEPVEKNRPTGKVFTVRQLPLN